MSSLAKAFWLIVQGGMSPVVNLTGVCGGGGTVVVEGLDLGRDIGGTWAWPCSDPKNWFLFFKFCSSPWRILPSCPGRAGPGVSPARPRARATPHRGQPQEKRKKKKI